MTTQPTPLKEIKQKVKKYLALLQKVEKNYPDAGLIKDHEFIQFQIDKTSFKNLIAIRRLPGFDRFGVFFGYDEKYKKITACFLGIDKKGEILAQHKSGGVQGEDTWPPPPGKPMFNLTNNEHDIEEYFGDE